MKSTFAYVLVLILLVVFAMPDVVLWVKVDHFQNPPMRMYRGDTAHYDAILGSAVSSNGPTVNAYFKEQAAEPAQFAVFQSLVATLTSHGINIVWLLLLVKLLVVLAVFFLLILLFDVFGVPPHLSPFISFAFVLLYGPASFQGYALGFWFLPFLLWSIYLSVQFFLKPFESLLDLWRPLLAIFLMTLHPVLFTLVGFILLLVWIYKLHISRDSLTVVMGIIWASFSCILFSLFFVPFLFVHFPGATDALYRIVAINTRLPIHLFLTLRIGLLAVLAYCLYQSDGDRRWLFVCFGAAAMIVGLNSYLITGTYIANDHYAILEDFFILFSAGLMVFRTKPDVSRAVQILAAGLIGVTLISVYTILYYLHFRLGYYGRWLPLHLSYLVFCCVLLWPRCREYGLRLFSQKCVLIFFCAVIPLSYGSYLLYKNLLPDIPFQQRAETYRDVALFLQQQPQAVVLADPAISEMVHITTNHFVYWSNAAFSESVTNTELVSRWEDMRLFFPHDPGLFGANSEGSVVGTVNRCSDFGRDVWISLATRMGYSTPKSVLCDSQTIRDAVFDALENAADTRNMNVTQHKKWTPSFEADLLVVTQDDTGVPDWVLKKYFILEKDFGNAKVYRYLGNV